MDEMRPEEEIFWVNRNSTIKRILIGAACLLGAYLLIPIFIARKTAGTCSKSEAKKHMTRPPFPTK